MIIIRIIIIIIKDIPKIQTTKFNFHIFKENIVFSPDIKTPSYPAISLK